MVEFRIAVNSYEKMPKFTKLLCRRGIQFKNSVNGQLAISVAKEDVEEFKMLARNNNIQIH